MSATVQKATTLTIGPPVVGSNATIRAADPPWDCLTGEGPGVCGHVRITETLEAGRVLVSCECGHSWYRYPIGEGS